MTAPSERDVARALRCARGYRGLGYQPLPSRMDIKGPMLKSFADYWARPLPESTWSEAEWKTTNIQLMTGMHWRLAVVDCDGDEAADVWRRMQAHHGGAPDTWVCRTGGGGSHFYYALPDWLDECPSRRIWGVWDTWAGTQASKPGSPMKGDWQKHKEVRILGDNALVIAPPSIHVETGIPYKFEVGPDRMPRPAMIPGWLLRMPETKRPECVETFTRPSFASEGPRTPAGASPDRDDVLAAIPDKIAVARRWGLRIASSGPNPKGWWTAHAIDRDDAVPSCQIHDRTGVFWDGRDRGATLSFFDLGAALGAYVDWRECCNALGAEFLAAPRKAPPARTRPHA